MARARRGRGEHAISQRSNGTWCGSISLGHDDAGKRRRRWVYGKTKREVQDKLRELQKGPVTIEPSRITLGKFLDGWLDTIKTSVAPSTHARYEQVVRTHIKPHIGHLKLSKLEPLHVQQLFAQQEQAGASVRQRELSGVILGKALKSAVRLRLLAYNPAREVDKPRAPKREMRVWDREQVATFLKAIHGDRLQALYVMAIATGMREGELFALEWSDVDLDGASVTVQRTIEDINGAIRVKEPKTAKSRRRIDLPKVAVNALREHRKRMLAEGNIAKPVFCDHQGGYLRRQNILRRSFRPLMKAAGVSEIRFHDLRHTAATLLLLQGVNPKVVSERLGHAGVEITLNTYSHVLPTMQKDAANKLDQLLG